MGSDLLPESHVLIAIYEKHTFRKPRVGSAEYLVSAVAGQLDTTISECLPVFEGSLALTRWPIMYSM
jgi:hypothetical protein